MIPELATVLARLLERDHHTGDDDPLFPGQDGYLDGSALRRRYKERKRQRGYGSCAFTISATPSARWPVG